MRKKRLLAAAMLLVVGGTLHAQDLAKVCHATSSYDLTVQSDRLVFDRPAPAPTRVVLSHGTLQTDGQNVSLNDEDQDRLALFQQNLVALMPRVKAVAQHGVALTMQAIHDESGSLSLDDDTRAELDRRLAAQAAELRDRATNLTTGFQPRLQQRLQALRPEIQALCPDIQRLSELQEGIRANNGRPLNLVQIGQ